MADKKISALTASTTPLAGTEVLPIVQGGSTVKVSVANLTAGRAVNTGNLTVGGTFDLTADVSGLVTYGRFSAGYPWVLIRPNSTATGIEFRSNAGDAQLTITQATGNVGVSLGNLVIGTAGKGIDFSANGGDVLTQYDEGSWTVRLFDAAGGGNQSATTVTGYYTRVGNLVHCAFWGLNNISTAGMTAGNSLFIELPFTAGSTGSGTGSFVSENITFNGRSSATPAVPISNIRAILRAYGTGTSSANVLVSNVGVSANIDYFSMTYRV